MLARTHAFIVYRGLTKLNYVLQPCLAAAPRASIVPTENIKRPSVTGWLSVRVPISLFGWEESGFVNEVQNTQT